MKRRAEKIMGTIGIIGFVLLAGATFLFSSIINHDEFQDAVEEDQEQQVSEFVEQMEDINYTLDASLFIIFGLVGIAALFLLKTKPIISALLFFIGAIGAAVIFWWMLIPIVPALLYLGAAISIFLKNRSAANTELH
ncbi:DUF4064 domain-containing protein [Oceanobacillus jeddahense]|uniref:DUF4064 domain-containing protein n=1 Tax=Oceanobacillus jeddahense TaxID=1462527 RepID=UPI0005961C98|nr:DUF4064 domain-containing protein [Oceanobacillus jeddahense]